MPITKTVSAPQGKANQSINKDTHAGTSTAGKNSKPTDASHTQTTQDKYEYIPNLGGRSSMPVPQQGESDSDWVQRHDAFQTANSLWPGGKPPGPPGTQPPSANLHLHGRVHDWAFRKNRQDAGPLVKTARQEYYNSVNKHLSYF